MPNNLPLIVGLVLVVAQNLCVADEGVGLAGINVGKLSQVQTETILLKAMAEREKARHSIPSDTIPTTSPATSAFPQPSPLPGTPATDSSRAGTLPVVSMISGSSSNPHATLLYSNGAEVDAHAVGTQLPGGLRLVSINVDGVVVSREGKNIPLGFSNHAPSQ